MKTAIAVVGLCVAVTGHAFCQSNAPIFGFAVAATGAITLYGGGVVDGFDSRVGGYNTSTNRNATGGIATGSTNKPAVSVGTVHVYGDVITGPGGTVSVGGGAVGDVAWNASNTGIEPGWTNDNMNVAFPSNAPPPGPYLPIPPPTVVGGSNITYLGNGTYSGPSFTSCVDTKPMIVTGNATLWVTGDFTVCGSGYVQIMPGASLTLYVGGKATFTGGVNGTGLASQFSYIGLPSNTQISFSGSASFIGTINAPQAAVTISGSGGAYGAVIAKTFNISGGASLHYDGSLGPTLAWIISQPSNQAVPLGYNATFTVSARGPAPLWYQWFFNQTNLLASGTNYSSLSLTDVQVSDAGNYSVIVSNSYGSVTSSNATLTVNDLPFIATQPLSQTIGFGSNVTFTATAYGAPPLVFQWYYNNSPVGSPTSGTNVSFYTLTDVQTNQSGNYSVQVFNGYGSVTSSNAALTVVLPPIIITQPTNCTNSAISTATFSVVASSLFPLSYQWQKNGTNLFDGGNISGSTTNSLTIASVSDADAAFYSVVVSHAYGSVTSSNATLTVIDPPDITAQPLGQRILLGNNVSFNVSVSGTAPFNYQWRFNSANILNATNVIYTIQTVGTNNTGNYSVVVTNLADSVTSSNALLTVLVPPTMALQLLAGYPLLNLNGMLSNNFVVQYNTDLTGTNWVTLLSVSNLLTSPYLFLDPAGVGQPARFYRAFMQ